MGLYEEGILKSWQRILMICGKKMVFRNTQDEQGSVEHWKVGGTRSK
jgi:hypothetical protein